MMKQQTLKQAVRLVNHTSRKHVELRFICEQ